MHVHHHRHGHGHHHHQHEVKNIRVAFFLNLFFTIIEFIGGFLTNSVAILSDAVHDLGDSFSLGLSWYFQKLSNKKSTTRYTYGYKRFSLLGAIINSIILTVGSILILIKSIPRLFRPEQPDVQGMLLLAVLGVMINGAAVVRLRRGSSLNERVVSLHLLEDVLGWLAVLIGAIIMHFVDAPIIDPILSIGIAGFILMNVYKNIRMSMHIVLQGTPLNFEVGTITDAIIESSENIKEIHDLHAWSADGEYNILTVHIVLHNEMNTTDMHVLKQTIREKLHTLGIAHATFEFETAEEECNYAGTCEE